MTQKQRLLTVLMTLMLSVTGAWALDGAGTNSDPYKIGSVQDWKDFAAITNADATGAGAWAVMTADIDLGTDQTNITPTWFGDNSTRHYHGTFDGQGHTLTVHYSGSTAVITPFGCTAGATIKNLHVAGSITSTYSNESHSSGLICNSAGSDVIQNIWVSADIKAAGSGWTECGAFIGCNNCGSSTVTDCLFTGTLTTTGGNYNGCFVGYVHSGSTTTSNCLSTGTFTLAGSPNYVQVGTVNNSYVLQHSVSIPTSMQTDATKLSDGTVTTALNASRTGDDAVWVQQGSQPMLKTFAVKTDGSGAYLIGSVDDWKAFADIVNSGTNPAANAKMTADIDLGTDATMVGNANTNPYQGVFNGQGHKLTVNWTVNGGGDGVAPFRYIDGATIQKLHVDGSISATGSKQRTAASLAAYSIGDATSTISECWSSASITGYDTMGGIFGVANGTSTVNITDCLFTGSIHPTNEGEGCCAGFASQAMKDGSYVPTINITRGLYLGSYTGSTVRCYNFVRNDYPDWFGVHTVTDCYYKNVYGTAQGTQASDDNLANGTTTAALNNGRTGDAAPWVQDPVSKQPRLKQFVLQQDGSGNFLIGSVQNWKDFATLVKTTPAINAKMTADINLGTDKTMAGTSSSNYQGVFDGQGHTITINFEVTENYLGLFRYISGATIKNLHVTGTISTNDYGYAGGIVGVASGTSTIQNCQSSVNIQSTIVGDGVLGGIVACSAPENSGAILNINDCLFNGSMDGSSTMTCGGFVAWRYDGNTVNISNSLFLPTSANVSTTYSACFVGHDATSLTNCYHKTVIGTVQGVEATAANLANGTTTTALNGERTGEAAPWVQDPVTNLPQLKLFASNVELTAKPGDNDGEYWATYYHQTASLTADASTTVYTGALGTGKVLLTEVNDKVIPAGNAVILKSTSSTITLTPTNASGTLAGNALLGTTTATAAPTNAYCLSKGTSGVGFYAFTGTIPANRGYLVITSIGDAPQYLGFDDGGTTEIMTLNIEHGTLNNGSWYTLDGRQLNAQPTRKGIYVRNGKKFIVK